MSEYLFVYGSLLPALAPPHVLPVVARLEFIAEATLPGRLHDLGPYPGAVVTADAKTTVKGKVFRLPEPVEESLALLDAYEEYDPAFPARSLYVRQLWEIALPDGTAIACWVYAYNRDVGDAPVIADGDYVRHRTRRS